MALKLSNNADGLLAMAISNSDTSLTLIAGHGSRFPELGSGDWFPITVVRASDPSQLEIMRCTARSGDTLTVVRAQEGTSAIAFNAGDVVSLRLTVAALAGAQVDTANTANTANRLQTPRTINGTSFDGSANITTANWGTARTITIGNTGKSVNGSANVSWSLAEIGVTAATETAPGIVELATTAEARALASAAVALTPARLADAFKGANQSLSGHGYQKLPGGLIIQWVVSAFIPASGSGGVTWPIVFPNACLTVTSTPIASAGSSNPGNVVAGNISTIGVDLYNWGQIAAPTRVIAIGY